MKNYTVIYTEAAGGLTPFPQAFTTSAKDGMGALRAFRLNKGFCPEVLHVILLRAKAPARFNARDWSAFDGAAKEFEERVGRRRLGGGRGFGGFGSSDY